MGIGFSGSSLAQVRPAYIRAVRASTCKNFDTLFLRILETRRSRSNCRRLLCILPDLSSAMTKAPARDAKRRLTPILHRPQHSCSCLSHEVQRRLTFTCSQSGIVSESERKIRASRMIWILTSLASATLSSGTVFIGVHGIVVVI